jgi:predicted RNA-binding protein with TRAM domain
MLRYLAFGVALTGITIATQLHLREESLEPSLAAQTVTQPAAKTPVQAVSAPTKSDTSNTQAFATGIANNFTEVSSTATQADTFPNTPVQAWHEDPEPPVLPTRFSNKGIDARPLKIAKQEFKRISVGDNLKLPIPQTGQSYEMSIEQVGRHKNGDRTLKGHLTNQPEYTVVVTEGQSSTYATISTPEGSFMLEAQQDQGWLVAAADLDSLVNPNLKDYQIPDIDRTRN